MKNKFNSLSDINLEDSYVQIGYGNGVYETVTCYLRRGNKILLLFRNKKEVDINKNKWIGVGGHIEDGETPIDAVIREVKEETNYDLVNFQKKAIIIFNFGKEIEIMHLFVCDKFKGKITPFCDEGDLAWFDVDDLTKLPMWEGDRIFLPLALSSAPFFEMVLYYKNDKLLNYKYLNENEFLS